MSRQSREAIVENELAANLLSMPSAALALAWLQVRQVIAQPRLLVFLLVLPIVFSTVLSLFQSTQLGQVRVVLPAPVGPVAQLLASEVRRAGADVRAPDPRSATLLARNELDAIVRVPAGIEDLVQGRPVSLGIVLSPTGSRSGEVLSLLRAATTRVEARLAAQRALLAQEPTANAEQLAEARQRTSTLLEQPAITVDVVEAETHRTGKDVAATGANQTTPGMTLMFALLFGAQTGLGLHRARATGTIARLFAAPVPPGALLVGTVVGNAFLLVLQLAAMVLFGGLVLGVRWGNLALLAIPAVAYACMAASFGAFSAAVTRTQQQLTSFSFLVVNVSAAVGGLWWPIEVTPPWMQSLAYALPTYWGMHGLQLVMLRGAGLLEVALPAAILLGFAGAFLAVGSRAFTFE